MKTLKLLVLGCFLALGSIACSNDDDGGNNGNAADGTITATTEGSGGNFSSTQQATQAQRSTSGSTTTIIVTGSDSNGKNLTLLINGFTGTGTYELGGNNNVAVTASYTETNLQNPQSSPSWAAPYSGNVDGQINVSEVTDTNIQGTFNFTGRNNGDDSDLKVISNGSFNVNFN